MEINILLWNEAFWAFLFGWFGLFSLHWKEEKEKKFIPSTGLLHILMNKWNVLNYSKIFLDPQASHF